MWLIVGYNINRKGNVFKIFTIVLIFCLVECSAGSCLNYGHACWGAHGKRNENPNVLPETNELPKNLRTKWFLSKLIQNPVAADLYYFKDDSDFDESIPQRLQLDSLFSTDQIFGHKNQEALSNDQQLFDENLQLLIKNSGDSNRIRAQKIMDKRSTNNN